MNSRQRRFIKRFVKRKLYSFIYDKSYSNVTLKVYLYPFKDKIIIDYPHSDSTSYIYVQIPKFFIKTKDERKGRYIVFDFLKNDIDLEYIRKIDGIHEITVFDDQYPEELYQYAKLPKFVIKSCANYHYVVRPKHLYSVSSLKFTFNKVTPGCESVVTSIEDVLADKNISQKAILDMYFNIDIFLKTC